MTVSMFYDEDRRFLDVGITQKLESADYEVLVPEFERLLGEHGRLRLVVRLHDFHGWTGGGLWEDLKFDMKHFGDVERLAIVGESRWQEGMAVFCKPFTSARVKYFDHDKLDEAVAWVTAP